MTRLCEVRRALKTRVALSRPVCGQKEDHTCGHWTVLGINERAFFLMGKRFGDPFSLITTLKNLNFLPQPTRFLQNSEIKILR